jgi:outer membrane protein OmpA-like peptidoglycan-associated protein
VKTKSHPDGRSRATAPSHIPASIPAILVTAVLLAVAILVVAGCGSTVPRRNFDPDFSAYERDTKANNPGPGTLAILSRAEGLHDRAISVAKRPELSAAMMERAIADARLALASARADMAREQADRCLRDAERARRRWEEMIVVLEQTEHVASQTASDINREAPVYREPPVLLPATSLGDSVPFNGNSTGLTIAWKNWVSAASSQAVPVASIEERLRPEFDALKSKDRARNELAHYVAGRGLQELELTVRGGMAEQACGRVSNLVAEVGERTDAGLRSSLEMERNLKADLRAELLRVRTEARSRQAQLYDAMRQLEGRYASITQEARGTIVSLADILFDFDKATLKRDVEFNLVKVATILNQFPEMRIQVEGHTDNVGSPEYNLDLSRRRAQAVHDFLVTQGVAEDRMTVEGFGMSRPIADNETDEGRAKNRRVDLVIQEKP